MTLFPKGRTWIRHILQKSVSFCFYLPPKVCKLLKRKSHPQICFAFQVYQLFLVTIVSPPPLSNLNIAKIQPGVFFLQTQIISVGFLGFFLQNLSFSHSLLIAANSRRPAEKTSSLSCCSFNVFTSQERWRSTFWFAKSKGAEYLHLHCFHFTLYAWNKNQKWLNWDFMRKNTN